MAEMFEASFPVNIYQYEGVVIPKRYLCYLKVTPLETPEGFKGPKIHNHKLSIAVTDISEKLFDLITIEMDSANFPDLVEPKNGFNKRDYLADLRTMPAGHSKIIGDEYPPNTLNRKLLLVSSGYETNIDILESEIALTFMERVKSFNLHPFEVEVNLTNLDT